MTAPPHSVRLRTVLRRSASLMLLLLPLGACAEGEGNDPTTAREIRDLVTALTPPPATAISAIRNDWHLRRREVLAELGTRPPAFGEAVLEAFLADPQALLDVRRGMLEVAAHSAPEASRPVLRSLLLEYGPDLGLRSRACELYAETSPVEAAEDLEGLLRQVRPSSTLPLAETLMRSWVTAIEAQAGDPTALLGEVAVDLMRDQAMRHYAVEALGRYPSVRGRETLRVVLTESTGNSYLRIKAGQALIEMGQRDPAMKASVCAVLEEVMLREAEQSVQLFLADALEDNCR